MRTNLCVFVVCFLGLTAAGGDASAQFTFYPVVAYVYPPFSGYEANVFALDSVSSTADDLVIDTRSASETWVSAQYILGPRSQILFASYILPPNTYSLTPNLTQTGAKVLLRVIREYKDDSGSYFSLCFCKVFKYWSLPYYYAQRTTQVNLQTVSPFRPASDIGVAGGIVAAQVEDNGDFYGWVDIRRHDGRTTRLRLLRNNSTHEGSPLFGMSESNVLSFFNTAFQGNVSIIKVSVNTVKKLADDSYIVHSGTVFSRP